MVSYIFSVKPEIFEETKPILEGIADLEKEFEKNVDDDEKSLNILHEQYRLKDQIETFLLKNADVNLELDVESGESNLIDSFMFFLFEKNPIYRQKMYVAIINPDDVKWCWNNISRYLKKSSVRDEMVKYALEHQPQEISKKRSMELLEKWLSILKHAAEHGNYYYSFMGYG